MLISTQRKHVSFDEGDDTCLLHAITIALEDINNRTQQQVWRPITDATEQTRSP